MAAAALFTAGCQSLRNGPTPGTPARHGTLLLIGGGLDDDNRPARIVIATAATGDQETVATIDQASAMFFTGGDQQRITDRYHPHDQPSPEWLAMGRLLARGGVIAGTSAGDAKMGEEDEEDPAQLGPRLGPGMRFLPWAISDSHFFERDRIGRLVAALEATGRQLGIGIGEDAAVEVDLDSGELRGISVSESLLVDTARLQRSGLIRTGIVARLVGQGDSLKPTEWLARTPPTAAAPASPTREMPIVEPGQNRQLAAWQLFRQASDSESPAIRQQLDGYSLIVFPVDNGNIGLEVRPAD